MRLFDITALTVNFRTPDLIEDCINSFMEHYSEVFHLVIDNGGCEKSLELLKRMQDDDIISLIENKRNIGHGPALNIGITQVDTPYVFLLDSDTRTERGGFLEEMLAMFEKDKDLLGCGWVRNVNRKSGVPNRHEQPDGLLYVHPFACLMDVEKFKQTRGFADMGAPALHVMQDAEKKGYSVKEYPIKDYIWHKIGGTRGMFGGNVRPKTDQQERPWRMYKI